MPSPPQTLCGTVISAGKMMKAVKVRTTKQVFHSFLKKHFTVHQSHLVSDPNSSLRQGDVVRIAAGWRNSKHNIRHIVTEIVAPWGPPVEERPPIPKLEDLREQQRAKREKNTVRRAARRKGESGDGEGGEGDPTLKERHTRVIGGPEVVGGEERVVLENEMGN
ncbi:MAG: hypothetical protein LQ338_003109 [Usnochroma carphineum]|nr:MAG: hypothetical protein LQ338_003109 [Usnochroma carphineum]